MGTTDLFLDHREVMQKGDKNKDAFARPKGPDLLESGWGGGMGSKMYTKLCLFNGMARIKAPEGDYVRFAHEGRFQERNTLTGTVEKR